MSKLDNRIKYVFMLMLLIGAFAIGNITGSTTVIEQPNEEVTKDEPLKEETKTKDMEPITLSGTSDTATEPFKLTAGAARFKVDYEGSGFFYAWLVDSNGKQLFRVGSSSNEPYHASTIENISSEGEYSVKVEADAPWSITIKQ